MTLKDIFDQIIQWVVGQARNQPFKEDYERFASLRQGLVQMSPRKNHPAQKVNVSSLQRILRDRYYLGLIVYKRGTPDEQAFQGRHDPLIDQDTFDVVQARLP